MARITNSRDSNEILLSDKDQQVLLVSCAPVKPVDIFCHVLRQQIQ